MDATYLDSAIFSKLKLRSYYPHEIEAISVIQVTETKTFDEIGHPVRSGLYDPLMGPSDCREQCETCHQFENNCPGHFGHIKLDVPLFNPVLFNFTFKLLKGSCIHCHRLFCNPDLVFSKYLLAQLRCLDSGVTTIPYSFESTKDDADKDDQSIEDFIEKLTGKSVHLLPFDGRSRPTRNSVELRQRIMHDFCKDHLFSKKTTCPLCGKHNPIMRNDGDRCILLEFTGARPLSRISATKAKDNRLIATKTFSGAWKTEVQEDQSDLEQEIEEMATNKETKIAKQIVKQQFQHRDTDEQKMKSLAEQLKLVANGTCHRLSWRAVEVREHLRLLWQQNGSFLATLFSLFDVPEEVKNETNQEMAFCPVDVLFYTILPVPPIRYRPISRFQGENFENPQTANLRRLLEASETVKAIAMLLQNRHNNLLADKALTDLVSQRVHGKDLVEKMNNAYVQLQSKLGAIFDSELDKNSDGRLRIPGIKQLLEKKQGLFRMNMMGKRVNFACRSVITPDPYLDIDEIGIPEGEMEIAIRLPIFFP